jgi:hypothetical protein
VVHEVAQQRIALYCVLVVRLGSEPLDTVCDGERLQPSRWKIRSTGTNIARRLWDQREQLRGEYEDVHGPDRALWPVQHPGVVLDAVLSSAHGACLGCQWFDVRGHWMGHSDWFERASVWPHRHQVSNGVFLDGPRRWRGGRFDPP